MIDELVAACNTLLEKFGAEVHSMALLTTVIIIIIIVIITIDSNCLAPSVCPLDIQLTARLWSGGDWCCRG